MKRFLSALLLVFAASGLSQAQVTNFDLMGVGGAGLLGSNQVPAVTGGGSGGEIGAGISFDASTSNLTINIGWGSGNGFTDLTGATVAGHIHGAADQNNNAGVIIDLAGLGGWNSSASNGGFSGTVNLTASQITDLFNGNLYINAHTAANGGGEIRGNLVPVPEPSLMLALAAGSLAGVGFVRRRFRPVVATA